MSSERLAAAIKRVAQENDWDPVDLATAFSYETGGTFDPWKRGPTTKWGTHRGLIQWGEPQARQYGVTTDTPLETQVEAAARYLKDRGVKSGDGLLEIYSAINAGGVGEEYYGRTDAHAGGAPGSVLDKVTKQMGGHRKNAEKLLGGTWQGRVSGRGTETEVAFQNPYDAQTQDLATTGYDVYQNVTAPTPPTVEERVAEQQTEPYGFGEQLSDSASSNWYTAWAARRFSEGAVDMAYMGPSQEEWEGITKTVPQHYHDYLLGAGSREAFDQRLKYAAEDAERQQRLAQAWDGGLSASLLSGVVDPIAIPVAVLTGGFGASLVRGSGILTRALSSGASAGAINAGMELGAQVAFDDPNTDPLMAFGIGAILGGIAGPLAKNPATAYEAGKLVEIGRGAYEEAKGFIPGGQGSGGAARNTDMRDSLLANDWGIADDDVATAVGGSVRFDTAGQMTTADEPLTRLVGQTFFEETVGFKNHEVVPDSVSVRASALEKQLLGNFNAVYQPALREYMMDAGVGRTNVFQWAREADKFRAMVHDWVETEHPSPDTHKAVQRAGQAFRTYYDSYRKELNRSGLASLNPDPNYMPKYADHNRIAEIDQSVDSRAMEAFVKEAILRHTPDLDNGLADRMAKGYWRNIRRAGYGIEDGLNGALGLGDKDAFKRAFNEALDDANVLSDAELDQVWDILSGVVDQTRKGDGGESAGISRLKRRTLLDYSFQASVPLRNGGRMDLKMNDLFVRDAEFVARRYGRNMSGRIAFANTQIRNPSTGELLMDGIKTEGDLEKLKNQVREAWRQRDKGGRSNHGKMEAAVANIDFGWKRINGIPVYGQEHEFNQWLRRIKGIQFIRLMSNMGLNQVQESFKLVTMTGFRAAVSQLPAIRRMVTDSGRSVARRDELLTELEAMTGMGLDGLWGKQAFRFDDDRIGATAASRIGNSFDKAIDFGSSVTSSLSLMRAIHTFQQRWAVKAISQQLYGIAQRTRVAAPTLNSVPARFVEASKTVRGTHQGRQADATGLWFLDGDKPVYWWAHEDATPVLGERAKDLKNFEFVKGKDNIVWFKPGERARAERLSRSMEERDANPASSPAEAANWHRKVGRDLGYGQAADAYADWFEANVVRHSSGRWVIPNGTPVPEDTFDLSKLRGMDRERLASIGIGDEEATLLFRNMLAHSEADGRKLVSLGSNKWDPEALTKFTYTLNRYTNRLVQQNDVGGLHRWMSHPVAQLFTQFRSFVLGAWAKSTLYSLHHMDPRMLVLLLGEVAFGTATFIVRQAPVQMMTDDGADKFWEETMDPVNLAKNGWARTATASILPMIADTALMFTPVGPQFASARASGTPSDVWLGSSAGGHFEDVRRAIKGTTDAFMDDREFTQTELNAMRRAFVPFGNWVPLAALFAHLIQDAPERQPRN